MESKLSFPEDKTEVEVTEKRTIKRLQVKNLFQSILQAFNLERGGIYTVKQLIIDPGKMVQEYIGTGRLKYSPPIRLLIVTTTLAFLSLRYSAGFGEFEQGFSSTMTNEKVQSFIDFTSNYWNILLWVYIPIAGFLTWLFNYKGPYNLAENFVFQAYYFCLSNIIIMPVILDRVLEPWLLMLISTVAFVFYYAYAYQSFYNKTWFRAIVESIVIYAIATAVYLFFVLGILFVYLKITN